jgi:hypothetical protein
MEYVVQFHRPIPSIACASRFANLKRMISIVDFLSESDGIIALFSIFDTGLVLLPRLSLLMSQAVF